MRLSKAATRRPLNPCSCPITRSAMLLLGWRVHRAAEPRRFIANGRAAFDAREYPDERSLHLPAGAAKNFVGSRVGSLGVFRGAFLVILRIVPIGDPFPDVARHVVGTIRTLAGFVAADRHQGFLADPLLVVVEMLRRWLDVAPGEAPILGTLRCLLPFGFRGQTFAGPFAISLGVGPVHVDHRPI